MLARVIKSTENAAWAKELHERIRKAAREDVAGNTLRDVLRQHGDLRLQQQQDQPAPGWVPELELRCYFAGMSEFHRTIRATTPSQL